jgi:hypothetical protein
MSTPHPLALPSLALRRASRLVWIFPYDDFPVGRHIVLQSAAAANLASSRSMVYRYFNLHPLRR